MSFSRKACFGFALQQATAISAISMLNDVGVQQDAQGDPYSMLWWGTDFMQIASLPGIGGIDFCRDAVGQSVLHATSGSAYAQRVENSFAIGLVRNPFNYYANQWQRFKAGFTGPYDIKFPEDRARELVGEGAAGVPEPQRFAKWLRQISSERLGLLTMRMYGTYMNQQDSTLFPSESKLWAMHTVSDVLASEGVESPSPVLEATDKVLMKYIPGSRGSIDCWVFVESAAVDMRHCLERYAQEMPQEDSTRRVHFESFDNFAREKGWFLGATKDECNALYDNSLRSFVLESDRVIFKFFGYEHGCTGE